MTRPIMKNPNGSHVTTAQKALKTVYDRDNDEAIADMLADLRHLCDSKRLDFAKLDRRAYRNYAAEMEGGAR
jgi:hypothetical protein